MVGLTKSDIETPRTIRELRCWYKETLAGLTDAQIRLREDGYLKEFFDEIHPALVYLEFTHFQNTSVRYRPCMGNQPYDGVLVDRSDRVIAYIECTFAKDGQIEKRRMEELMISGLVSANTKPPEYVRGAKWRGGRFPKMMVSVESTVTEISSEISRVVLQKLNKAYSSRPTLVVGFEMLLHQVDYERSYKQMLWNAANVLAGHQARFDSVWLVEVAKGLAKMVPDASDLDDDWLDD